MAIDTKSRVVSNTQQDISSVTTHYTRSPPSLSLSVVAAKPNGAAQAGRNASGIISKLHTDGREPYSFNADEIFVRHSVPEVKNLLYKVRLATF